MTKPKYLFLLISYTFIYIYFLQSVFPITSSFGGRCFCYLKFSKTELAKWINIKGSVEQIGFFLTQVLASMGLKNNRDSRRE